MAGHDIIQRPDPASLIAAVIDNWWDEKLAGFKALLEADDS